MSQAGHTACDISEVADVSNIMGVQQTKADSVFLISNRVYFLNQVSM